MNNNAATMRHQNLSELAGLTTSKTYLESLHACQPSLDWVGDRTPEQAWAECPRGDWLLWILEEHGVDCSEAGYWCAERARQHALGALPPSQERDALAACAQITDRTTAEAAEVAAEAAMRAAAREAAWAAREAARAAARAAREAARAAARAAEATARAARAAAWAAEATAWTAAEEDAEEHLVIADYVRAHYTMPEFGRKS